MFSFFSSSSVGKRFDDDNDVNGDDDDALFFLLPPLFSFLSSLNALLAVDARLSLALFSPAIRP